MHFSTKIIFIFTLCLFLFLKITTINGYNITFLNTFSPSQYNNPNAIPNANDTVTTLTVNFGSEDGTPGQDNVNGFEFDDQLPASNGGTLKGHFKVQFTDLQKVRYKQLLATVPQKQFKVLYVIRADRSSGWFVVTGNVQQDPNVQGLGEFLFNVNSTSGGGRRRRLLNEDEDEEFSILKKLENKYFFDKTKIGWQQKVDKFEKLVNQYQMVANELQTTLINGHKVYHLKSNIPDKQTNNNNKHRLSPYNRKLLQTSGGGNNLDAANPVILSAGAQTDIDSYSNELGQFLTGQNLAGAGAIASQGAAEVSTLNGLVQTNLKSYTGAFGALQGLLNLTGPEYNSFQTQYNATTFNQLAALQQISSSVELLVNRTQYITTNVMASISTFAQSVDAYQTSNNVKYNATLAWLNTMILSTSNFAQFLQANFNDLQSIRTFASFVNSKLISWYTQENIRNGKTLKYHQLTQLLESAGYKVIASLDSPPQIPLGHIPLQAGTTGYFYRFTIQYTTNQPHTDAAFYNDVDMVNIPNYQSNSNYINALTANDNIQIADSTGGSWYAHFRQISLFCSLEQVLILKNTFLSLQDVLILLGPPGCTPGQNGNCQCWATVTRQRCGATGPFNSNTAQPLRQNIWDFNGCLASPGAAQTETNLWFASTTASLSTSLTQRLASETFTTGVQLMNELNWMCTESTCNSPQTVQGSPPNPQTHTYAPYWYYTEFSQSGAPLNATTNARQIPNNISLCGIDVQVMTEQSLLQNGPTIPYAFFKGAELALQALLNQAGQQWKAFLDGTRDGNIYEYTIPFHTPPSATCPTCTGPSASGSTIQKLHATIMGVTSQQAYPLYFYREIGRTQTVTVTLTVENGQVFNYTINDADMVDNTPSSSIFLPQEFIQVGFQDCILNPCPSPDPGFVLDGISYVIDTPKDTATGSNATQQREDAIDYFADLSYSTLSNTYTLFPTYTAQFPPPVISVDQWNKYNGQLFLSPKFLTDSPHKYIRAVTIDPITGKATCSTPAQPNANAASFPDGQMCELLSKEIMSGTIPGFPNAIDAIPYVLFSQINYERSFKLTFPGTLLEVVGSTTNLCPSQQQMYFKAVAGSWVTLHVVNGFTHNLAITITMTPLDNSTLIDSSILYSNCNITVVKIIQPNEIASFDIGRCDQQQITVQSYGQMLLNDPTSLGYQTCWNFKGSMNAVFSSQYISPESISHDPNSTTSVPNLAILGVQQSQIASDQVNSIDTAYKLNLYKQSYISYYGNKLQINVTAQLLNYVYTLPAAKNVSGPSGFNVLGITLAPDQLNQLTTFQQQLITINTKIVNGRVQASQDLINLEQLQTTLQSEAAVALVAAVQAAANESSAFQSNIDLQKQLQSFETNITSDIANNRIKQLTEIAAESDANSNLLTTASKVPLFIDPYPGGSAPVPVSVNWPNVQSGWSDFVDFCAGVFQGVVDVFHAVEAVISKVLGLLNPSCLLGLCNIFGYLMYALYAIGAIVGICICFVCVKYAGDAKQTMNILKGDGKGRSDRRINKRKTDYTFKHDYESIDNKIKIYKIKK